MYVIIALLFYIYRVTEENMSGPGSPLYHHWLLAWTKKCHTHVMKKIMVSLGFYVLTRIFFFSFFSLFCMIRLNISIYLFSFLYQCHSVVIFVRIFETTGSSLSNNSPDFSSKALYITGMVYIGWRGPSAVTELYKLTACAVLLKYLTDTAVSPVPKMFVDIPDPYCSQVNAGLTYR